MKRFCRGEKSNRGANHGNAKLTEDNVREIRVLYREGKRYDEIAPVFGITKYTVASIIKGRTWGFVSDRPEPVVTTSTKHKRKSPNTQRNEPPRPHQIERCKEFFALKQTGMSYAQIGKQYNVGRKTVYEYIRRYELLITPPASTEQPRVVMVV